MNLIVLYLYIIDDDVEEEKRRVGEKSLHCIYSSIVEPFFLMCVRAKGIYLFFPLLRVVRYI